MRRVRRAVRIIVDRLTQQILYAAGWIMALDAPTSPGAPEAWQASAERWRECAVHFAGAAALAWWTWLVPSWLRLLVSVGVVILSARACRRASLGRAHAQEARELTLSGWTSTNLPRQSKTED